TGATITASLNGQSVPLQVDVKATNPDGSLRHAVLTVIVPSLGGAATIPLMLSAEPALPGGNNPIAPSQLLATSYDAWVSVNIAGKTYKANARTLLQAADSSKTCAPWGLQCNVWLSGPQAGEWVVNGPLTAPDGTTDPNLKVYFAVRAYAGAMPGTVGSVHTDVIIENSSAFSPQAQPQYTAALTSGTATYTSPALTQYAYTRWHKQLWWNNAEPQVYLQQDTQYIQASNAVSRYMPLKPDEKFLASLRQSCAPLDHCDQTQKMHMTGAQASIGPLPRWTSVYIVHPDVRAYNWMLANTDALGAYGIHYRDAATGWPVSIQKHPNISTAAWTYAYGVAKQPMTGSAANQAKVAAYRRDLLPNCVNNAVATGCTTAWYGTGNPTLWDNAHQPAESYVPYMVTGSYYYMSELAFGASQNELWSNPVYRGYSQGLIDDSHSQVRGKAWTLRNMANAAWLLPDDYPLKAEFHADVENSLADWNQKYTHNPSANPLGLLNSGHSYGANGGTNNAMAPWMHNFFTWSAGHAEELGFSGAAELRDWLARFEIGLMTGWQANPAQGYCWLEASAYTLVVTEPTGKTYLPSYSAMYAATFPTLVGLVCNSPGMVTAMGTLETQSWQAGKMHGYAYSATGYPANLQIGVAAAADSAVPNAQSAWNLFDSRSVKPNGTTAYNNYPNFAVVPRSVSSAPVDPAPVTNPVPPTTPAAPSPPPPPTTTPPAPPTAPAPTPPTPPTPPPPAPPAAPTPPPVQPGVPPTPSAGGGRRPILGNMVGRALDVMDGAFSYFEILPRLLPYAVVQAMRTPPPQGTATQQRPPESANLPQLPDATSPVQYASATLTAQSAKEPEALQTQPANITVASSARPANGSSLKQRTLEPDCRTPSGGRMTQPECIRQRDSR
ncbi:MAG: hypothetical protein ABI247_05610, partial [Rhodanobacter sp.]